jgi:hypothetical protein
MAKRQILNINTITAGDIKRRHPRYLTCETDRAYARLANDIHELIHEGFTFMEERQFRNACISMALYFEDMRSDLHLFEAFTRMYQQMYGYYLPFYSTAGADAPDAGLDAMRFMLWHSCVAEREGAVINPTNNALKIYASKLLNLWNERKHTLPSNDELADYLYDEDTQTDADQVKTVLVWLSHYCPLGRWFTNPSEVELKAKYGPLLRGTDKDTLAYAADCYTLFEHRTWPLSVTPWHVFAEMIRIDMDDPNDELAEAIDHIEGKPFSIFEVMGCEGQSVRLTDFLGNDISVSTSDFFGNVEKLARQNTHLAGSFICLGGKWHLNGPCLWSKPKKADIDMRLEGVRYHYHLMHDYVGQYDDFIRHHGGERLYFFRNSKEHEMWLRNELGLSHGEVPEVVEYDDAPMAVFFEDNGQMTCCFDPACIKHPSHTSYDPVDAEEKSMSYFSFRLCSPGMLLYLIEHDLLPDIMFNDMLGREHGRLLLQDNIDFMARCLRRDIECDTVVRPRTKRLEEDNAASRQCDTKVTFETFVRLVADENSIRSRANKEWRVMRANATTTVIRDVDRCKDYSMPTRKLHEAHLALSQKQIQVSALVPFVGKDCASAASALLYNIVGQGKGRNSLRKLVDNALKDGGFEELHKRMIELLKM